MGTPSTSEEPSEPAQVDRFWAPLHNFDCMGPSKIWTSLRRMTRDVDFVVVGRLVDVTEWGAQLGRPYSKTVVLVAVDEVLKGQPIISADGSLQFSVLYGTPIDTMRQNLPENTHVLFLNDDDPFPYYLPARFQNVFVDLDGQVGIPWATQIRDEYGRDAFPLNQRGRPFAELLNDIRRAAAREAIDGADARAASLLAC